MELITKEGFDFKFNPKACEECGGKCCTGESGYIWVPPIEITKIANFLNIEREQFLKLYTIKVGYKTSLIEKKIDKDNFACIFFDEKKKNCSIYEVRPTQCRTFPFWEIFKKEKDMVKKECVGIVE